MVKREFKIQLQLEQPSKRQDGTIFMSIRSTAESVGAHQCHNSAKSVWRHVHEASTVDSRIRHSGYLIPVVAWSDVVEWIRRI